MSLKVQDLCKIFRDKWTLKSKQVLFDVSFSVSEGSVTGFLGSNGAGKTTTMKCLLQLLEVSRGQISFFESKYKDPRKYIGYLPERPYFYDYLTGLEFLMFYGQISSSIGLKELKEKSLSLLDRVGIPQAYNLPLRSFSKGMLQRIGLAQAVIHDPKFLILDEPMSGLDPDGRYQMSEIIMEIASGGTTVFFSSHLLDDVERLCEDLVIIDSGRIIFEGPKDKMLKTSRSGYEVVYLENGNSQSKQGYCKDLQSLIPFLNEVEQSRGHLIEVKEPRIRLEEAFAKIKEDHRV